MFSSNCRLNLVKENDVTSLRNALLQDLVSHRNIEVPSLLVYLPGTHVIMPFTPVHATHHRKPQVCRPLHLLQNPVILDHMNGPFAFLL